MIEGNSRQEWGGVRWEVGGVRLTEGGVRGKMGGVRLTEVGVRQGLGRSQGEVGGVREGWGRRQADRVEESRPPGVKSGGKWEEFGFHGRAKRWRSPSKGMYSINRTSTGFFSVSATKSSTSSSFMPRITTQFTCRGQRGTRSAFFTCEL